MKTIIASIIIAIGLIISVLLASGGGSKVDQSSVYMENGKQIIVIGVKGGYHPGSTIAKSGVDTVIRFKTSSTFDCSSFIRIPSLGVSQSLPQTGSVDVSVGTQSVGVLQGTCGMGMYRFSVEFK